MTEHPTPQHEQQVIPCFVYGSLRTGLYNHVMAVDSMVGPALPAVVHGFELYANKSDTYPYLAQAGEGDVKGEVLLLVFGRDFERIRAMEEGAGYDTRAIKADVEFPDGETKTIDVVAWVHDDRLANRRGTKVEDGDWIPYYREAEKRLPKSMRHFF